MEVPVAAPGPGIAYSVRSAEHLSAAEQGVAADRLRRPLNLFVRRAHPRFGFTLEALNVRLHTHS